MELGCSSIVVLIIWYDVGSVIAGDWWFILDGLRLEESLDFIRCFSSFFSFKSLSVPATWSMSLILLAALVCLLI